MSEVEGWILAALCFGFGTGALIGHAAGWHRALDSLRRRGRNGAPRYRRVGRPD